MTLVKREQSDVDNIKEAVESPDKDEIEIKSYEGDFSVVLSTGSTLLDLAISGGKVRGGGIPSGIMVEIFGPSGTGKTAILSEVCAYNQGEDKAKGGDVMFLDPEGRLDKAYSKIYGEKTY